MFEALKFLKPLTGRRWGMASPMNFKEMRLCLVVKRMLIMLCLSLNCFEVRRILDQMRIEITGQFKF